jgi:hypothetical protein
MRVLVLDTRSTIRALLHAGTRTSALACARPEPASGGSTAFTRRSSVPHQPALNMARKSNLDLVLECDKFGTARPLEPIARRLTVV